MSVNHNRNCERPFPTSVISNTHNLKTHTQSVNTAKDNLPRQTYSDGLVLYTCTTETTVYLIPYIFLSFFLSRSCCLFLAPFFLPFISLLPHLSVLSFHFFRFRSLLRYSLVPLSIFFNFHHSCFCHFILRVLMIHCHFSGTHWSFEQ